MLKAFIGFTLGALFATLVQTRRYDSVIVDYERTMADLRVKIECSYHEGEAAGYQTAMATNGR